MAQKLIIRFGVAFCLGALCSAIQAQVNTATLLGTVQDSSGASVPGATVTVKNLDTGLERSVTAEATGNFTVANLPVGHYSLTASFKGFQTTTIPDIELQVAQMATVNPVLQVGSTSQEVTVTGTVPLLNTVSSSIGQVVDTGAVEAMPLNGRSFWQLTQLTPGASYTPGGQNIGSNGVSIRASIVNVNVNGTSPIWTGWSLDGANVTEFQLGGTLIQPNVDALQEFKVESANMDAEYGHTPTMVNATLKNGTNRFRGDVYEFFRNDAVDADNFFHPFHQGSPPQPIWRNLWRADQARQGFLLWGFRGNPAQPRASPKRRCAQPG